MKSAQESAEKVQQAVANVEQIFNSIEVRPGEHHTHYDDIKKLVKKAEVKGVRALKDVQSAIEVYQQNIQHQLAQLQHQPLPQHSSPQQLETDVMVEEETEEMQEDEDMELDRDTLMPIITILQDYYGDLTTTTTGVNIFGDILGNIGNEITSLEQLILLYNQGRIKFSKLIDTLTAHFHLTDNINKRYSGVKNLEDIKKLNGDVRKRGYFDLLKNELIVINPLGRTIYLKGGEMSLKSEESKEIIISRLKRGRYKFPIKMDSCWELMNVTGEWESSEVQRVMESQGIEYIVSFSPMLVLPNMEPVKCEKNGRKMVCFILFQEKF